jgi:hypothetical protein
MTTPTSPDPDESKAEENSSEQKRERKPSDSWLEDVTDAVLAGESKLPQGWILTGARPPKSNSSSRKKG